jgi:hypothetical protein
MKTIVFNQNNLVQDGNNNTLVYKFPNSVTFSNSEIAIAQITMYYSWFNVTNNLRNNSFTFNWINAAGTNNYTTYTIYIPDGLYEIAQLNSYFQFVMISNDTYLIDSSGKYVYYAELVLNPTRYAVQLNTFLFPTLANLPSGYTAPSASFVFPIQSFNPIVTFPANFNNIVGYNAGFASNNNVNNAFTPAPSSYVTKGDDGTISYLSTKAPNVQPNSSVYFSLSNINNPYSQPSSIIYS